MRGRDDGLGGERRKPGCLGPEGSARNEKMWVAQTQPSMLVTLRALPLASSSPLPPPPPPFCARLLNAFERILLASWARVFARDGGAEAREAVRRAYDMIKAIPPDPVRSPLSHSSSSLILLSSVRQRALGQTREGSRTSCCGCPSAARSE